MTNVSLYEIAEMRTILDSWLIESEGELTPEIAALLDELDVKADEKIERVALFVREQLATAKAIREEEDRLAARRKAKERAAESLKVYLQSLMERLGKEKVNGLLATVAIQSNPPSVRGEIAAEVLRKWWQDVGDERVGFVRFTPEQFSLDRRYALDAHKRGDPLPAGLTIEQTHSIRIR